MIRATLWAVTLVRVALLPLFVHWALTAQALARAGVDPTTYRAGALATLVAMGVSDVLDGWLARRFDLMTRLGAIVDAIADKTVQIVLVAFFTLSIGPVFTPLPLWFLVVVFAVEAILLVGYLVLRLRYGMIRVVHRTHGRLATLSVSLALFWAAFGLPRAAIGPIAAVAAVISVGSATIYALNGDAQGRARE